MICRGRLNVYAPRGSYQLIIERIEPKGIGALELALRQLWEKLAREGLFDPARKRPLPRLLRRVALVTSPTGAAIHDFLQVLKRRWRGADVLVVPTRVQGVGAAEEIAAAIGTANRLSLPIDCLVLARGGGSLEDLWAFNEEVVVRAVVASRIPVVSAIGHEVDVTLSDLAANVRALTPSEAAELIAPAADNVLAGLRQVAKRLAAALRRRVELARRASTRWRGGGFFAVPCSRSRTFRGGWNELDAAADRAMRNRLQVTLRPARRRRRAVGRLESLGRPRPRLQSDAATL